MANDRLHGFSMMEDERDSVILGNTLEVFAEKDQAGFVVGSLTEPTRERMIFRDVQVILRIRMLIGLMREMSGLPSIEEITNRLPDPNCPICQGRRWYPDEDGNQRDCALCLP